MSTLTLNITEYYTLKTLANNAGVKFTTPSIVDGIVTLEIDQSFAQSIGFQ